MSKPNYKEGGLIKRKYDIGKNYDHKYNEAGELVAYQTKRPDPDAQYFVLRIDEDPYALAALKFYAHNVREVNPDLAADLQKWIAEVTEKKIKEYGL